MNKTLLFEDAICSGCLSEDRQSSVAVKNELDLFFSLLGVQQEYFEARIVLCWECQALLKKVQSFQSRIQRAQYILQQSLSRQDMPITTLSSITLTNTLINEYPAANHESYTSQIKQDVETKPEPVKIKQELVETKVTLEKHKIDEGKLLAKETEEVNLHDDADNSEDFNVDEETNLQDNLLTRKKTQAKSWSNTILRYESKAQVSKINFDAKPHYTTVVLTENEIEKALEREIKMYGHKMRNKCSSCEKKYMRAIDLMRHRTFNHNDVNNAPSRCLHCKVAVKSWKAMESHWRKHNQYLKCKKCEFLTHSKSSIKKHRDYIHSYVYSCKECDTTCSTLRKFSEHYQQTHEKMICDYCNKITYNKRVFVKHMKRHHLGPLFCKECNTTFKNQRSMSSHMAMKHPHLIGAETSKELRYCVECDEEFASVQLFRRHLNNSVKHRGRKPDVRFPCPECGKVIGKKHSKNHFDRYHAGPAKHHCHICTKSFFRASKLREHHKYVHDKVPLPKNKICDICGRAFTIKRILDNHRRTHTGERPFKCSHCPAAFAQRTAMKTHERTQHKHSL